MTARASSPGPSAREIPAKAPDVGDGVTEGVHGLARVRREGRVADEEHPGRADRHERPAGPDDTDAAGGRRVVAPAAGHDDLARDAPTFGELSDQLAGRLAPLDQTRHLGPREPRRLQKVVRPVAPRHVEPERAGRVRHFRDVVAGQPEPHVVFWEEHGRDVLEELRLVAADPGELRCGETRHGDVARDLARSGKRRLDLGALRGRTAVVPEDRRAQHRVVGVEAHRTVHLSRKSDATHIPERMLGGDGVDRRDRGAPPILGILLRPARSGSRDLERRARLRDKPLIRVDQHRLDRRCADVDAEIHRPPLLPALSWRVMFGSN
jgi:hypothetical protein